MNRLTILSDSSQWDVTFYEIFIQQVTNHQASLEQIVVQVRNSLPVSTEVTKRLVEYAYQSLSNAPRRTYIGASIAYETAVSLGDTLLVARCAIAVGDSCLKIGLWEQAVTLYHEAQTVFSYQEQRPLVAHCVWGQATAYHFLNQNLEAWSLCQEAWEIFHQLGDDVGEARVERVMAHISREREAYEEALKHYERARSLFHQSCLFAEATCCDQDIAFVYLLKNQYHLAEVLLETAYQALIGMGWVIDAAYGRRILAVLNIEQGRYEKALHLLQAAYTVYQAAEIVEGIEGCERNIANVYRKIGKYEEAVEIYFRLRSRYVQQKAYLNIARCDMLLAMSYEEKNQYDEALQFYHQAEEVCIQGGLAVGAARCQTNMATIYEMKGMYGQAIELLHQAKDVFSASKMTINVAHCDESLARLYQVTNQHERVLDALEKARQIFATEGMYLHTIAIQVKTAVFFRDTGQFAKASDLLLQAHEAYTQAGMPVQTGLCNLWLGDIWQKSGQPARALEKYQQAQEVFVGKNLPVYIGRCDLGMAGIHFADGNYSEAKSRYTAAKNIFHPDIPEWAWQTDYGLGQCAEAEDAPSIALIHYLAALDAIVSSRHGIYTEVASGSYFAGRKHVYDAAILLAAKQGQTETLLEILEASKAQAFLTLLYGRHAQLPAADDTLSASLLNQEQVLQEKIDRLERELGLQETQQLLDTGRNESEATMLQMHQQKQQAELQAMNQQHQEVVERLTRLQPLLQPFYHLRTFSLNDFRQCVNIKLSVRWRCLLYYLTGDQLIIVYMDDQKVQQWVKPFPDYLQKQLATCVSSNLHRREHVYKGSVQDHPTTSLSADPLKYGKTLLRRFYTLLIPPEAIEGFSPDDLLLVVPHQLLHTLPFHALLSPGIEEVYLVQQATVVYTPSLHTWQLQVSAPGHHKVEQSNQVLVCGVTDFGWRANKLQYVKEEVEGLQNLFGKRCKLLWQEGAKKEVLTQLAADGELTTYSIIHFATHARFDEISPLQSRILLHQEDLTVTAVLHLPLQADIVTLSACDTALQKNFAGDEMVGLVNAFFLAGAKTLLVSLWQVEDRSTSELMQQFYKTIATGLSPAHALHQVQRGMILQGHTPYQWAPFVLLGHPGT